MDNCLIILCTFVFLNHELNKFIYSAMIGFKKIDVFIIKQFSLLFTGTFFISLFVLMMQFLWKHVDTLIGKGLSIDVLAMFFWQMGLLFVPQALPLAILLSSLITYGNLGESSELTAIKAAGISLLQSFRGLIIVSCLITIASFYFQNNIGPNAQKNIYQLLISMKQKSPELEIPEGVFYNGIPQTNLYVEKRNLENGHLYNIMVYKMTDSYEDQAIILADSGMLQSTADNKHLVLNLWNGEWFENMKNSEFGNNTNIPYRRENFVSKKIVIDFDADFNLTDLGAISGNVKTKSIAKLQKDRDSLEHLYDSIGKSYYTEVREKYFAEKQHIKKQDNKIIASYKNKNIDTIYDKLSIEQKRAVIDKTIRQIKSDVTDLDFKSMVTKDGDTAIRKHKLEVINKYLTALTCLIFFFIGAPLGAIIRKGGLGIPIILSVIIYIIYYILDTTGVKMAQQGAWAMWFGRGLSPAILLPTAIFITYKANNDSTMFNMEVYANFFKKIIGIRAKRNLTIKEVIIHTPKYEQDAIILNEINHLVEAYTSKRKLKALPNFKKIFLTIETDNVVTEIKSKLEAIIEDLGNTRNRIIMNELNNYPILNTNAHLQPSRRKWLNIVLLFTIPIAIILYIRIWRFRIRLDNDLRTIIKSNDNIIKEIYQMRDSNKI